MGDIAASQIFGGQPDCEVVLYYSFNGFVVFRGVNVRPKSRGA